jgi:hypothetical protein
MNKRQSIWAGSARWFRKATVAGEFDAGGNLFRGHPFLQNAVASAVVAAELLQNHTAG